MGLLPSGYVTNNQNNRSFKCIVKANCQTDNLIYFLTCKECGDDYVGKTLNRIMDRGNNIYVSSKEKTHIRIQTLGLGGTFYTKSSRSFRL